MEKLRIALRIILPIVVIAIGVGVARKLVSMRPKPGKKAQAQQGALVETAKVETTSRRLTVAAQGEVVAAQQVTLQPQVSGKVLELHPRLVAGGKVAQGETLLRIEDVDYRLGVAQARTQLEQAKQALALEKGRQAIAKREWKLLGEQRRAKADGEAKARALRGPQLAQAEAQVDAAKAALRQARVNVGRAKITAPFNAVVLQENVDLGQVVAPGAQLARLVGTDAFWVQVSIPLADLKWLSIPKGEGETGSKATVTLDTGDGLVIREGHLVRLLGDLDPVGRLARVVVQIDDPLGLKGSGPPLLLGAFVKVAFDGKALDNVVELPRLALHEGGRVWLYADGKLESRTVTVTRRLRDSVLVSKGLKPGEQIIVSRLATPVPGMPLRRKGDLSAKGAAPANSKGPGSRPASRAEVAK